MLEKLATALVALSQKIKYQLVGEDAKTFADVITEKVPNFSYPGDNCCDFFADPEWRGTKVSFCIDPSSDSFDDPNFYYHWDMRDYGFDDVMSSYTCGKNVQYDICDDPTDAECTNMHGDMGAGTAYDSWVGNDDTMTELLMRPYDAASLSAVTIYEDPNCSGRMGRLFAPTDVNSRAMYTSDDLSYWDVAIDRATAIRVPYGLTLELYDGGTFDGAVKVVQGSMFIDSVSEEFPCISI